MQRVEGQLTKVIKPFNLGQTEANAIYGHGDTWLQKVRRLRSRNLLPKDVLFAVAPPPQADGKRYAAYCEICDELQDEGVQLALQDQENQILAFAAPQNRGQSAKLIVGESVRKLPPIMPLGIPLPQNSCI